MRHRSLRGPGAAGSSWRGRRRRVHHAAPKKKKCKKKKLKKGRPPKKKCKEEAEALRAHKLPAVSPDAKPDLRKAKAWKALEKHHAEIGERHLREIFAEDPDRGERLVAEGAGLLPRLLQAPRHRRDAEAAGRAGEGAGRRGAPRRDVRRRAHQRQRGPRGAARGAADAEGPLADRGRRGRGQAGARGARPHEPTSRTGSAAASGPATPASRSATWSTSASAARTWAR